MFGGYNMFRYNYSDHFQKLHTVPIILIALLWSKIGVNHLDLTI